MKKLLPLLGLLLPFLHYSQDKLIPFGKADKAELTMKECAFERNANAMKLLDYEEKEVIADYGLKIRTERRVKIKIFNEKGFEYANISIPYISRIKGTKITDISAYIYYLDSAGNIVTEKVSKKQIFRDEEDDKIKKIKFTFPHVKPGCIVEYRYEKREKNSLAIEPWVFQDFIPTLYSSFTLILPFGADFNKKIIGIDSLEQCDSRRKPSSHNGYANTYILRNVAAFKPEPMMSSIADNLQRIEFAVQPSSFGFTFGFKSSKWEVLARALNEMPQFGQQFGRPIIGTEGIIDSARKIVDRDKRINYVFQEVKKQVKWDEQQTFYCDDLAVAWKERSGNSAEINLIVLNLLRKCGISCSPILVSTRENGKLDQNFFSLSQFNGVDVLILDSVANYVLDGTRKFQSYKTPPDNILNRSVLDIDTAHISWLYVSDSRPLLKSYLMVDAELTAEGKLKGRASIVFYDHSKVQRLMDKNKTEKEKEEEEKEFLQKDFTELVLDSVEEQDADNELEPLTEKFKFTHQPSSSGDFIFLDPMFLSSFRKNPFTDSIRHSDLDFGSRQLLKTTVSISFPESYVIDHQPKNMLLRMADSSILFERRIYTEGNKMLFINTMEVLYPLFEKEEYEGIREFFSRLYAMATEQIIFKHKKEE